MDYRCRRFTIVIYFVFTIYQLGDATSNLPLSPATTRRLNPLLREEPWCRYRSFKDKFPPDVFRLHGCGTCYVAWTNYAWFIPGRQLAPAVVWSGGGPGLGTAYQGVMVNGTPTSAHYDNPVALAAVANSFRDEKSTQKWIECCQAAEQCCDLMITLPNQHQVDGCPATWDGWQCWRDAKNHTTVDGICPGFTYSSEPSCMHPSSKVCLNATWLDQSDYSTCDIRGRLRTRLLYHVYMMFVSLVVSVPAIVIFFSYRKLRESTRVVLHRNLLIAIVAHNILSIIAKTTVLLDALRLNMAEGSVTVMAKNELPCKVLAVCERLAANAVFVTMLLLGIFLHRLIAAAFRGEPNMFWYYIGGAVINCLPVIAWTVVMATLNDHNCWTVDTGRYHWINDAPRIIMLVVNLILIADIVRVLVTKLSSVKTGSSNKIRRTIKATIFLTPVFGVQFLFTAFRPNTADCTAEQVYYFFSYGIDGLQGAVVSLLFCYLNNEVQALLRRSFCTSSSGLTNLSKNTFNTLVEPNNKDLSDPPTPIMDTRSVPHRPTTLDLPRGGGILVNRQPTKVFSRTGSFAEDFYTPDNSIAGSPLQVSFYTPKSSVGGEFFDCLDDEPIVKYRSGGDVGSGRDNRVFTPEVGNVWVPRTDYDGRERSASEYFDSTS